MAMYYTYVLQSLDDMKFYVGYTKDLKLRFEEHTAGLVESTRDRRPLVYYEACLSQSDALKREKYLKHIMGRCL
jgi:putative endonuclease